VCGGLLPSVPFQGFQHALDAERRSPFRRCPRGPCPGFATVWAQGQATLLAPVMEDALWDACHLAAEGAG
jgi:hypothetical protein